MSYDAQIHRPPTDRFIRIVANIIITDGAFTDVEAYRGLARWGVASGEWFDSCGMPIRGYYDADLNILEWEEVSEGHFELVGDKPVERLMPQPRRATLALPAPSWHTELPTIAEFGPIPWSEIDSKRDAFIAQLRTLSDRAIVDLREAHDEWQLWFVMRGSNALPWKEHTRLRERGELIEELISNEIARRFRIMVCGVRTVEREEAAR